MSARHPTSPVGRPGNRLKSPEKIKPLDPDKPLMPTSLREPGHAKFRDTPGQLTLDDMGAIELPETAGEG